MARLPDTLELIFAGMTLAIVGGLTMGVVSARWRGGSLDFLFRSVSLFDLDPRVLAGPLLQLLFFRWLHWLP